jgi:hypothetical protein
MAPGIPGICHSAKVGIFFKPGRAIPGRTPTKKKTASDDAAFPGLVLWLVDAKELLSNFFKSFYDTENKRGRKDTTYDED